MIQFKSIKEMLQMSGSTTNQPRLRYLVVIYSSIHPKFSNAEPVEIATRIFTLDMNDYRVVGSPSWHLPRWKLTSSVG